MTNVHALIVRKFRAGCTVLTALFCVLLVASPSPADDAARDSRVQTAGTRFVEVPINMANVQQRVFRLNPIGGDGPTPHGGCPSNTISHSTALWQDGTTVAAQGGMLEGEWCAQSYDIPTSEFPIKIINAEALLASPVTITAPSETQWGVKFWQGSPATGTSIAEYHSDGTVLEHVAHPVGFANPAVIIQFAIDPGEPGEQIVIGAANLQNPTNTFSVGFSIDQHNNQLQHCLGSSICDVACNPNDAFCGNLCTGNNMMYCVDQVPPAGAAQIARNWIFGVNCGGACFTGWRNFSQIASACRPTGDWMIRVTYETNCVIAPTITEVIPPSANNAGEATLQILGSNFNGATLARLTRSGEPTIFGSELVVAPGNNSVTAEFDLTGAALGLWNVEVAAPGGTGFLANAFEVTAPAPPTIDAYNPSNSDNDRVLNIQVTGTEFVNGGTTVRLVQGQTTITATNVNVDSPTSLTADFDLRCQPTGLYSGQVSTSFGTATQTNAFLMTTPPPPTVFGADATDTANCPGSLAMTVFGSNLFDGALVYLARTGQPDLAATNVNYGDPQDHTSLIATFNTAAMLPGTYDLKVVNPDCDTAASSPLDWQLTVNPCVPTVSSVTPNTGTNHQPTLGLTINGGSFVSGATVKLTRAGQADIVATNVTVVTPAQITCTVSLQLVQIGLWRVVVTNPGGATSVENVNLNVTAGPAPTVSLVTPASPTNCGSYNATILGTNYAFASGVAVQLELAGQPNIIGTNVVRISSTQLTATFDLTGVAITPTADKWDCRVTNPDGQNGLGLNRVNVVACSVSCTKGDVNADTLRDGRDVSHFTRVYLNPGSATAIEQCACDLAAPAGVEANDVPAFVNCLLTGACP